MSTLQGRKLHDFWILLMQLEQWNLPKNLWNIKGHENITFCLFSDIEYLGKEKQQINISAYSMYMTIRSWLAMPSVYLKRLLILLSTYPLWRLTRKTCNLWWSKMNFTYWICNDPKHGFWSNPRMMNINQNQLFDQ